jgi:hypothetical protein
MSGKRSKAAKPRTRAKAELDLTPMLATAQAVGLLRGSVRTLLSEFENLVRVVEEKNGRCLYLPRAIAAAARSSTDEAERLLEKHGMAIRSVTVTSDAINRPMRPSTKGL